MVDSQDVVRVQIVGYLGDRVEKHREGVSQIVDPLRMVADALPEHGRVPAPPVSVLEVEVGRNVGRDAGVQARDDAVERLALFALRDWLERVRGVGGTDLLVDQVPHPLRVRTPVAREALWVLDEVDVVAVVLVGVAELGAFDLAEKGKMPCFARELDLVDVEHAQVAWLDGVDGAVGGGTNGRLLEELARLVEIDFLELEVRRACQVLQKREQILVQRMQAVVAPTQQKQRAEREKSCHGVKPRIILKHPSVNHYPMQTE